MASGNGDSMELRKPRRHISFASAAQRDGYAVYVRNAYKSYGIRMDSLLVLDGLDMTVPRGVIYGLLGSSGCGKTTLLNCILGRKRLNTGDIWVLGGRPGSKGSGVPGPRIGYMPQSVGLYGEFSIRETLFYFGWIVGIPKERIEQRLEFLVKLLMLPNEDRIVKDLSGGQQRRVSLAAALLHEPELLVLDEPTVGLDPILRQNIWDHLIDLTNSGDTTVIITTHYIDETRQANLVAFMRSGYLLTESSPSFLLREFESETLEHVFLKLSEMQNVGRHHIKEKGPTPSVGGSTSMAPTGGVVNRAAVFEEGEEDDDTISEVSGKFGDSMPIERRLSVTSTNLNLGRRASIVSMGRRASITSLSKRNSIRQSLRSLGNNVNRRRLSVTEVECPVPLELLPEPKRKLSLTDCYLSFNGNHMKALIWKNFMWMMRNVPIMIFITILPFVHTVLFCSSIGHNPKQLEVAIVNYESKNMDDCLANMNCNSTNLGCHYLNRYLKLHDLKLIYYDSAEAAVNSVMIGDTYASVVIKGNFSNALQMRIDNPKEMTTWDIDSSEIDVFRELSNSFIAQYLKIYLYDSYERFLYSYLDTCEIPRESLSLPIKWNKPIYGTRFPEFIEFAAPGITITAIFMFALALTALAMLVERSEGSFERSLVLGITAPELIGAYIMCQFVVVVVQSTTMLLSLFLIFKLNYVGSIVLVAALVLLCGFCGMCFGMLVSCLCDSEKTAFYISMGSTMPMLALGGVIWPVEGMHWLIQPLVYTSPLTFTVESLRSVMQRGWSITDFTVYIGFISTGLWSIFFLLVSVLIVKFKKG